MDNLVYGNEYLNQRKSTPIDFNSRKYYKPKKENSTFNVHPYQKQKRGSSLYDDDDDDPNSFDTTFGTIFPVNPTKKVEDIEKKKIINALKIFGSEIEDVKTKKEQGLLSKIGDVALNLVSLPTTVPKSDKNASIEQQIKKLEEGIKDIDSAIQQGERIESDEKHIEGINNIKKIINLHKQNNPNISKEKMQDYIGALTEYPESERTLALKDEGYAALLLPASDFFSRKRRKY
jgi:hypothetical protein